MDPEQTAMDWQSGRDEMRELYAEPIRLAKVALEHFCKHAERNWKNIGKELYWFDETYNHAQAALTAIREAE